jgi:hypothetical protein
MNTTNPFEEINAKLDYLTSTVDKLTETNKQTPTTDEEELLDTNGASKLLLMPISSIHYHKKNSNLPSTKKGKRLLFRRGDLLAWLNSPTLVSTNTSTEPMKALRKKYSK